MKESFTCFAKLTAVLLFYSFAFFASAQTTDKLQRQNEPQTSNKNLPDPPDVINALYGGEGLYRNFQPYDEAVEKRSVNTKHFKNQDGTVTAVVGAGNLHYDENGQWKTILSHILQNTSGEHKSYELAALHNKHKIFFPKNPGKPILSKINNEVYQDWGLPAMVWLDANANVLSEVLPNASSTGTANKDSLVYKNIFPFTDAVILNSVTTKKLNYLLKDSSVLANKPNGAVFLAFRETITTNPAWKLTGNKSEEKIFPPPSSAEIMQNMMFADEAGKAAVEIKTPVFLEHKLKQSGCTMDTLPPDSTARYFGSFLVKKNNFNYETYTLVPVQWLTHPNRDFPVVIDPTTNYYPDWVWSYEPTYSTYRGDNSGSFFCTTWGGNYNRVYEYDIAYGWADDTWPTNNPYFDGYATFNLSSLSDGSCISSATYYWYRYDGRGCGSDITLKFGMAQFNQNLAEEVDCNTIGVRIRNNNSYYNGSGKNGTGWHSQTGTAADVTNALAVDQISVGWGYNGGDDCCTDSGWPFYFSCTGDDGNWHNVYGTQHSTAKPYVEVNYSAPSTAASSASVSANPTCPGQSTTLSVVGGALGTSANWQWYSTSCGGTFVSTGSSISVSPASTTTYYVRAEGTCNTTGCVSVTVNVSNTNSTAATGINSTANPVCPGQSTTLSVSGGVLGTNASWYWYSGGCGGAGTFLGSGSSSLSVTPSSTTTYYVRAEGTCNTTACATVTINVNSNSSAPSSASASVNPTCGGTTTLSQSGGTLGSGADYYWYESTCGGALAGIGSSINVTPSATTTYYVSANGTCNTTSCVNVTITVNTNSTAPTSATTSSDPICQGSSTTLTALGGTLGTGANYFWYDGSCGSVFVGNGSAISVSPSSTTTYYVRAEGDCGNTSCTTVTVNVNANSTDPASASVSASPICPGQSATISVNGGFLGAGADWQWYSTSCGGIAEGAGASVIVSPASTTTYYVRAEGTCNNTNCAIITVDVNTESTDPTSASASANPTCSGDAATLSVAGGFLGTGADWVWYDDVCGGTIVGNGDNLPVSPTATITYYVQAVGTCNSTNCVSFALNVNPLPDAIVGSAQTICENSSVQIGAAAVVGNTYSWSPASGLNSATTSDPLASPASTETYTLTETITATGCSKSNAVIVNVNPAPAAVVGPNQTTCNGQSVQIGAAAVAGNTYSWSPVTNLNDSAFADPMANPPNTTVYTLTETVTATGCQKSDSVTVFINQLPVVTINGLSSSYCIDAFVATLNGSPSGGTFSGTGMSGDNFDPAAAGIGGPYAINYAYTDGNGCTNDTTMNTYVYDLPVVTYSGFSGPYCASQTTPVTLTGNPSGGAFTGQGMSGNDFYPNIANVGANTVIYYYTDGNSCSNSYTDSVTVIGVPYASFTGLDTSYCVDNAVPVILTGTPSGGTFSGNGMSGNDFTPSAAGAGTQNITYTFTDGNGCYNSQNQSTTVYALPLLTFSGLDTSYCVNGTDALLAGFPSGGTFSGGGISGNTFSPSAAGIGNYPVTYTYSDTNSCTNTVSISTNVYDAPVVSFSGLSAGYCENASAVALSGTPPGGTFSGNGISGNNFYPSIAGVGTHSITYTYSDGNNCSNPTSQTADVYSSPVVSFSGLAGTYCANDSAVLLTGTPAGGTFSGNGISGNNFEPSVAGAGGHSIKYVYSDANGCADSSSQNVFVNAVPVVDFFGLDTSYCENGSPVALSGFPNGGIFSGNGITGNSFDPAASGTGVQTITYSYTDGNGCVNFASKNAAVYPSQTSDITPDGSTTFCNGGSVNLTANSAGSYSWNTGSSLQTITVNSSGTYTVTLTNSSGCSGTGSISVTVNSNPSAVISSVTDASCNGANDGSATVSASGGAFPYSYTWDGNTGNQTFPTATGLIAGTYMVSVSDINNCSASVSATVNNPSGLMAATFSGNSCVGGSTGSATVMASGGTSPYSYQWSNGGTSASLSNIASGIYSVTVADNNLCTFTTSVVVNENQVVFISTSSTPSCTGGSTGTATAAAAGGTIPYSYSWSNGGTSSQVTNLTPQIYSVTISDANLCSAAATINVDAVPGVNLSVSSNGGCGTGGTATANVAGGTSPYTYFWNTGDTTSQLSDISSQLYFLTVTDANGCSANDSVNVTANTSLIAIATGTDASCSGGNDGTASAAVSGGTLPYSYLWSNGTSAIAATGLFPGTYTVTITDANSCTVAAQVNIASPPPMFLSDTSTATDCGANNGTATVIAVGGTTPYSYVWDNGATSPMLSGLATGIYSVTVTDGKLCTQSAEVLVSGSSPLSVNTVSNDVGCSGGNDGSAAVAASGTSPYFYIWSNGDTVSQISNLIAQIYYVTVTDANNCSTVDSVIVSEPLPMVTNISSDTTATICRGDSITLSISGGNSYLWSTGQSSSSVTVAPVQTQFFSVIVFDQSGCNKSDSVKITVVPFAGAGIMGDTAICLGKNATITAIGGTNYRWNTGDTTQSIIVNPVITTSYYVIDSNVCFVDTSSAFTVNVSYINVVAMNGINDTTIPIGTSIQLSATGGNLYLWAPPQHLNNANIANPVANPATETVYIVTGKDASGCAGTDTVKISIDDSKAVFVPNIFSPNGDGDNEILYVLGKGITTIKFIVYDRWGEKVFESGQITKGWDGMADTGIPVNAGVYVYHSKVTFWDDSTFEQNGNITLVR